MNKDNFFKNLREAQKKAMTLLAELNSAENIALQAGDKSDCRITLKDSADLLKELEVLIDNAADELHED